MKQKERIPTILNHFCFTDYMDSETCDVSVNLLTYKKIILEFSQKEIHQNIQQNC